MPENKQSKPLSTAKPKEEKPTPAAAEKKSEAPAKPAEAKPTPAATEKKADAPAKPAETKAAPSATEKKPDAPAKPTEEKPAPAATEKKADVPAKPAEDKAAPATTEKKSDAPAKSAEAKPSLTATEKQSDAPAKPAADKAKDPETAKKASSLEPPKGVQITKIFDDRLEKPDEKALKSLPVPKEGEGYSMRLHPSYFFEFLDHPFTVNREVADYKELFDSIKENGINEPVKARPRKDGGLELISGHRRHDIAVQLNYPVPVVITQIDDDTAKIEVVDGNLHRMDIPTSELARAAKMKMDAMKRKAGRRSKMERLAEPQKRTDEIVASEMGMSRNQVNRLTRITELVPELQKMVDDKVMPFNTAVEISFLSPNEQADVVKFIEKEDRIPSMEQAKELKEASQKAAEEAKKLAATEKLTGKSDKVTAFPGEKNSSPSKSSALATEPPKPAPAVDMKKIASVVKEKKDPEVKYVFTSGELKSYFPNELPTVSEVKRTVFEAMDMRQKAIERKKAKEAVKDSAKSR